ncbi:MAG: hypothetical protein WDK95_13655 [Syntrophorhabdaceae bacterium]
MRGNTGIPFKPGQYTDNALRERKFDHQFELYLKEKKRELDNDEISPEHYRHLEGYNNNWFTFFHEYDVKVIDLELMTRFKDTIERKGKTIKHIMFTLCTFMAWLHSRGTIEVMPAFPKVKKTNDSRRTRALTPEQQTRGIKKDTTGASGYLHIHDENGTQSRRRSQFWSRPSTFKIGSSGPKDGDRVPSGVMVRRTKLFSRSL